MVSSGTTIFTGLPQGRKHWARSRGVNGAGPGPWSVLSSAYTLSGGYISNGSAWLPAEMLISDGTKWLPAEVLISDGTSWKPSG